MRHPDGDAQALAMMQRHFRVPRANATTEGSSAAEDDSAAGGIAAGSRQAEQQRQLFDTYLWLSQLQQARCYETAFAQWRRHMEQSARFDSHSPKGLGRGRGTGKSKDAQVGFGCTLFFEHFIHPLLTSA